MQALTYLQRALLVHDRSELVEQEKDSISKHLKENNGMKEQDSGLLHRQKRENENESHLQK